MCARRRCSETPLPPAPCAPPPASLPQLEPPEVVALTGAETVAEMPMLVDMASRRVINRVGKVEPVILPCTQFTFFAILDSVQRVQFVGFSRDFRNTLRRILFRQPDKAYYYMSVDMGESEPEHLAKVQRAWMADMGRVPDGNQPQNEAGWIGPSVCGTTVGDTFTPSADLARQSVSAIMETLRKRGLHEDFEFDKIALSEGMLELLPVEEQTHVEETAETSEADDPVKDLYYLCTRNKNNRDLPEPDPVDIAARAKERGEWIAAWRAKTGGEKTYEFNPQPVLNTAEYRVRTDGHEQACHRPERTSTGLKFSTTVEVIDTVKPSRSHAHTMGEDDDEETPSHTLAHIAAAQEAGTSRPDDAVAPRRSTAHHDDDDEEHHHHHHAPHVATTIAAEAPTVASAAPASAAEAASESASAAPLVVPPPEAAPEAAPLTAAAAEPLAAEAEAVPGIPPAAGGTVAAESSFSWV